MPSDVFWNGSTADWSTAADWSGGVVPTTSDAAIVTDGAITIASGEQESVGLLTLSGATSPVGLVVDGVLTAGTVYLTAAAIDGTGTILAGQFSQGTGSRDDDAPYASVVSGQLVVIAASLQVGGGRDGGFTVGQGDTLIGTGSSTIHQGFIDGAGTLANGTSTDSSATMAFASSATLDAVTFGSSPDGDTTTVGSFINWGEAIFGNAPATVQPADFSATTIDNTGLIQFGTSGAASDTKDGDISAANLVNNDKIEFVSGVASIGLASDTNLSGNGIIAVDPGARAIIQLDGSVGSGQTIYFSYGADAVLQLDGDAATLANGFQGSIENLSAGDTIDLASIAISSVISLGLNADGSAVVVQTTAGTFDLSLVGTLDAGLILMPEQDGTGTDLVVLARPTDEWTDGAGDGQWTTPGNWSDPFNGGVPTLADAVQINAATVTIGQMQSADAGSIELTGGSELIDAGLLFVESPMQVTAGNVLVLDGGFLSFATSVGALTIDAGGRLQGYGTFEDQLVNDGTVEVTAGETLNLLDLSGNGTLQIDSGATLLAGLVPAQTVAFAGPGGELLYTYAAASFDGPALSGIVDGDSIVIGFDGSGAPSYTLSGSTLTLAEGAETVTFNLTGAPAGLKFLVAENDGTLIATAVPDIPPVVTVPAPVLDAGGGLVLLPGVSVSDADPDYTELTVTITLTGAGVLGMATNAGLMIGTTLTVSGDQQTVDAALATLDDTPGPGSTAASLLTVNAVNNGPGGSNAAVAQSFAVVTVPTDASQFTAVTSGDWSMGSTWSSGTVPGATDDVVIGGDNSVVVSDTEAANSIVVLSPQAQLAVSGTLDLASAQSVIVLAGGTLAVDDGLILGQGGTIDNAGGGLAFRFGTLDSVAVRGDLDVANGDVTIQGSFSLLPLTGSGPGTIAVTLSGNQFGNSASLYFNGDYTLQHVAVSLNGQQPTGITGQSYAATIGGVSLTLDSASALDATDGAIGGTSFTNDGLLTTGGESQESAGSFVNAGSVVVAGGTFSISGGSLTNDATITVRNGASLLIADSATVGALGAIVGADGSTTEIATAVGASGTFYYADPSTLILDDPATFGATIAGLASGDVIDVANQVIISASISGTALALGLAGGEMLTLTVAPGQQDTHFTFLPSGGVSVSCFGAGTRIATPDGPRPIETLRAGDAVRTVTGALRPITWIGSRTLDCARHPNPAAVRPVRVCAGAFGLGLPRRDLFLSPDHAVFVSGVLVPIKYLIDGVAIVQTGRNRVTYFHIELPTHDVLLAEGLPAESYLDTGDRTCFPDNGVMRLHPAFSEHRADLVWEAAGYAPLVITGPTIAEIRADLAARHRRVPARPPGTPLRAADGPHRRRRAADQSEDNVRVFRSLGRMGGGYLGADATCSATPACFCR